MRHILIIFIILSAFLSLSLISCSKKDDSSSSESSSSSSESSTASTQTFVDSNHCRLTKNTSSRNSSLIVNERESDSINERRSDSRSSKRKGSDKYVDKSALSQYQTDNYLLLDAFDLYSDYTGCQVGVACTRLGLISDYAHFTNNPPDIGNNFTVELRFQFNDKGYSGAGRIIGSASGKAPKIEFRDHGKQIRYGFGGEKGDFAAVVKPDSVNLENWHHIATTFDGTNYKLYLDGVELNNSTYFSGKTPPEPPTVIGQSGWRGKIDEVRIWNDTRTQGEIQANMNKTLVGNEAGLVAYYPMDLNNNWEIIDKTSNANHAKISNAEILPRFFDNSSCTNGPDGTTTCPYPTIRSALDNVTSGDHVYIREGRYTEMLTTEALNVDLAGHRGFSRSSDHQSGLDIDDAFLKEEDKIIFEGYPGEEVIIDGTVALNDNSSNWVGPYSHTLDNGTSINIYKTVIDFDSISRDIMTPWLDGCIQSVRTPSLKCDDNIAQVFVNGRYMIPALPMNIKNPTDPTTGNPNNPEPGTIWARIGRSPFKYPASDNTTWGPDADPRKGNHDWYMPAKLENLDYPEEWAFDPSNKTLYLYASDNYTPTSNNVRVRVRERSLMFLNSYNFELKNLHFFAGSIMIYGGHLTIEDSKFSHSYYHGYGRTQRTNHVSGDNVTFRNTIFEHINDGVPLNTAGKEQTFENILVRHIDWYMGSSNYLAEGSPSYFRYVTFENSYSGGIFSNAGSLVEYARFENLYDGCDCSAIQRNANNTLYSTTRYSWMINSPGLKGMRFDSSCGGNNGDIYNVVSIGNHKGFFLKGDYHDVYHVTAYDNEAQDISLGGGKFCGLDGDSKNKSHYVGNWNSNIYNSIAHGSFPCSSRICLPETVEIDGENLDWLKTNKNIDSIHMHFSNLETSGIWFGRSMSTDTQDVPNFSPPFAKPHFDMQSPWLRGRSLPDSRLQELYGKVPVPWEYKKQSYDFRPKKGSYLIDSGVVIPGINNGEDVDNSLVKAKPGWKNLTEGPALESTLDLNEASVFNHTDCTLFNHPNLYSGQNRKYVGDAPDIGAYEYGDSVYWIPGYRYPHPSVPIPNDGAVDVPIDYSLVWNYPYKKDYSNTEATVTVSGPGVNRTEVYKYPYNVHFQTFEPGGTYNWSVTVDNVSGGNWSFKTDDKIYPLNDRSVDTTDKTSLIPYQMRKLNVSNNTISFLSFDIPSTITNSHKINLKLVVDGDSALNSGISIQEYGQTGWGESPNSKNIGIIDHTLGATIATLTPLDNGTIVWDNGTAQSLDNGTILSIDLTDKITSYGEEYSIGIRALGTEDKVTFFSKEKTLTNGVGGYAPQVSVWPNISFK